MLYNALYTVLYIATYTNSNSTTKKVTIAYDRCVVRDDACQRPSPPVCTVINTRERTDQSRRMKQTGGTPPASPRCQLLAPGRAGARWAQGQEQRALLAPWAVPWGTDGAWGTGGAEGGRAGAGRGGRRWAAAWGAVGGGSRAKPSPDFHPAAAQAGGCWEHPGSPELCQPHGHHQLPPRCGPSTQVQPIPVPSTQSPPSSCPPLPGLLFGGPTPRRPLSLAPHRTTTVHTTLTNTTPPHTRQPHGHEPQRQLRNGTCPGGARPGPPRRGAGGGERGRGWGLFSSCWCGGGVPGHGHPRLQTPACQVLVSCWVCPSCRHPPCFSPARGAHGAGPPLSPMAAPVPSLPLLASSFTPPCRAGGPGTK